MISRYLTLAVICVCLNLVRADDECGQFETCKECLDLNMTSPDVGRANCGWCHVEVKNANGTLGKRCADIRQPWDCADEWDSYKCTPGWACDPNAGKCIMANPGEGFGSNNTCSLQCKGPHPGPPKNQWRCNTTSYICESCDPKNPAPGCSQDRGAECKNCVDPGVDVYKCNKTDPDHPKCNKCNDTKTGCSPFGQACTQCAPQSKLFKCDNKTMSCKESKDPGSTIKLACDANCGKFTPTELIGRWRGLNVKSGMPNNFLMGEIDMIFGDSNLTVVYPNRTQVIYDVSTTGGSYIVLTKGKDVIKVVNNLVAYLKHTVAMGLSTYGPGQDAPDSFRAGVASNKSTSLVMWKCNDQTGKGLCDFKPQPPQLAAMVAGLSVEEPVPEVAGVAAADEPNDQDLCNKFETCASCINADEHNIKCGFCLGGFLSYEGVGKTTYKCGGYVSGQPNKFTCPEDFKTTDCRGWLCDYASQTCHESENGQYPTQAECMVPCSQTEVMRQCNTTTKKCEPCKDKSDPDCVNRAFCDTTCGKPHASCDFTTGKCSECDPAKDPDTCKLTKDACDEQCKPGAASKCNHATGKCEKCTSGAGCVPESACNHTCEKTPPKELYGCDWTANPPQCKQEPKATTNKTACEQECHAVEMGKCDFENNTCVKCKANAGDPDCLYTMDYCKTAQKEGKCKKEKLDGLYRMLEVQKGFKKGEFDLLFKDGKLHAQYYDTKVETKEMGDVKTTGSSEGGGVTFEVTNIQKGVWPFDSLFGVYHQTFGEAQTFIFLELAMSNKKITKLDDGLTGENKYYVGAGCMDHKACDFSKATPANFDFTTKFETEFARYGFFLA